jgi:hypothetical protein
MSGFIVRASRSGSLGSSHTGSLVFCFLEDLVIQCTAAVFFVSVSVVSGLVLVSLGMELGLVVQVDAHSHSPCPSY